MGAMRGFAFFAILLLASSRSGIAGSPRFAGAEGPSPIACPSVPDLPNDLQSAFAYDLESPAILHFISALATAPQADQKHIFDAASDAASSPREHAVETAVATLCPSLGAIYGTTRVILLISKQWTIRELFDAKRADAASQVIATAVSALSAENRLAPEQRASAMLPFGNLSVASPSPTSSESGVCSRPDAAARVVHTVQPEYPASAISAATEGTVLVKVALSAAGDVQYVRLYGDTLRSGIGSPDLVRATIIAAAASTYAPDVRHCAPIAGAYVFKVEYRRK